MEHIMAPPQLAKCAIIIIKIMVVHVVIKKQKEPYFAAFIVFL
jgi:hypothetical protein